MDEDAVDELMMDIIEIVNPIGDVLDEIERLKLLQEDLKYRANRIEEYLTIEEQLDQLYWDNVNGTSTWADHIAQVKAKYPKPE